MLLLQPTLSQELSQVLYFGTLPVTLGAVNLMLPSPLLPDTLALQLASAVVICCYLYQTVGAVSDFLTLPNIYLFTIPHHRKVATD